MTTLADIETVVAALPLDEQKSLLQRLAAHLRAQESLQTFTERHPGLHRGQVWISDDFDAPLPESFWLGSDS